MIREYRPSDLNDVNELLSSFNYNIGDSENKFLHILVYINKKISGVLVYQFIYDRIEIDYIIVRDEERRRGIATDMIKYLIKNMTVNNITLEVKADNYGAIELYRKLGFETVAIRKNYYKDVDGLLMMKKLGVLDE